MKRRIFSLLLPLALLLSATAQAVTGDGSALLPRTLVYAGEFADVGAESWYYPYVAASYEYGLLKGRGDGFAPDAEITVSELLTLSARLRAAYEGEAIPDAAPGEVWYAPYAAYLSARGLLPASLADYEAEATRAQLAGIFALSLPEACYDARNDALVTDAYASRRFITDVDEYTPYCADILWLYRQGLLNGMDETGSYHPQATTTRAEAAALITRIADPALRITPDWTVVPYYSAVGTTLADLVDVPAAVPPAPAYDDAAAIDAALRQMLADGTNTLTLRYPTALTRSDATSLARAFTLAVKGYCEQMYNTVLCQSFSNGDVTLVFSASGCPNDRLAQYRAETMAKAVEVHDMLWETGQLTGDMSEYEIARVYFRWLCDHCEYDHRGASDDYSLSHIAYNALLRGKAVCDGYTGAYNIFLKLEGIRCRALPSSKVNHIWTVATLDGVEYHIDPTWGDQTGYVDEHFFGMTAEESYAKHPW